MIRTLSIILISAVITFTLRALPFIVFNDKRKMPEKMIYLGKILPLSIMTVLVIYCLKDVGDDFMGNGIFKVISVLVVAVTYKMKHSTLISILCGTICYMCLIRL
mgnify:FL=1